MISNNNCIVYKIKYNVYEISYRGSVKLIYYRKTVPNIKRTIQNKTYDRKWGAYVRGK